MHALIATQEHDEQIEEIKDAYDKAKNAPSSAVQNLFAQEALDLTKQYLAQFFPDEVQGAMHLALYPKTIEIMSGHYD